jgi:arginase
VFGDGRSIAVIDAPSNLGLRPPDEGEVPGVYRLASSLRSRGLVSRLGALDGGGLTPPPYTPHLDPETTVLNGRAVRDYAVDLAAKIGAVLEDGRFPLVLGGDCSILLGSMLALRSRGRFGLVFLDGHLDFRHPGNSEVVGAAAGADLALVTGRGPEQLTNIDCLGPLVRNADVVALGEREDYPEWRDIHGTQITVWNLQEVRALGAAEAGRRAVERMEAGCVDGFWIHLDADVLDDNVMPAVDSRQPDGLSYVELIELLRAALNSDLAVGMQVTIFDPELDPTGQIAEGFASAIVKSLVVSDAEGWEET